MNKKFLILDCDIKDVLKDYNGPKYCMATDRITVDGEKIRYFYKLEPDFEGDSGFVFMAGDESDEYMENPSNIEIYELNTICNYDQSIIEFLDIPYNTAYYKENDTFIKEEIMI